MGADRVSDLPKGWVESTLGQLFSIKLGQSPPSSTYNSEKIGLPFFQGKAEFSEFYPKVKKWCSDPKKIAKKDSVLISVRAPVGPTNLAPDKCCIGRGLASIEPVYDQNPRFILYQLRSIERTIEKNATGTTFRAITGSELKKVPFLFPPLPEQHRIVAKIEELFTKLDAGVAALRKAKTLLKQYRQAVLKAAVEGKLTEEWRREHKGLPAPRPDKFYVYVIKCSNGSNYIGQTNDLPKRYREHKEGHGADWTRKYPPQYVMYWEELDSRDAAVEREKWLKTGFGRKWIKRSEKAGRTWHAGEIEPASVLLERIQAERKQRLGSKYKPPKPIDTSNLPELPDGWVWASVGSIGEVVTGTTPSKKRSEFYGNDYPFYKPADLNSGYYVDNAIDSLSSIGIEKARLLPKNTVLVTCIGATIGKAGLIRKEGASNQQINAIINDINIISEYLYFSTISPFFQNEISSKASSTTLPILNKSKFEELPIMIPSTDEQLVIVNEIERLFSIIDESDQIIDAELKRSQFLRQSILKRAFEGKLVPQDPADPPACELLERIREEKKTV